MHKNISYQAFVLNLAWPLCGKSSQNILRLSTAPKQNYHKSDYILQPKKKHTKKRCLQKHYPLRSSCAVPQLFWDANCKNKNNIISSSTSNDNTLSIIVMEAHSIPAK